MTRGEPDVGPRARYRARYRARGADAARATERLEARMRSVSRFRTLSFLLLVVPLLLLETSPRETWPFLVGASMAGFLAFLFLVRRHRRLRKAFRREGLRRRLNEEGEARMDRRWKDLPPCPLEAVPGDHPSAGDLDLAGEASLARLLGRATTVPGRAVLRRLLLDPFAPPPTSGSDLLRIPESSRADPAPAPEPGWRPRLEARQEAVRFLAGAPDYRERLELLGREGTGEGVPAALRFLEWARGPGWLPARPWIVPLARGLALFTPLTLTGWALGWLPGLLPALGSAAALALQRKVGPPAHAAFSAAEGGEGALSRWTGLLAHGQELPTGTPLLEQIRNRIRVPEPGAPAALQRLVRLTDLAGTRRSALAHFPLTLLFAWDVHVLHRLETWRGRHGSAADDWILALGELEALASLAGLFHDHPSWSFPHLFEAPEERLLGRELGHPLLRTDVCVPNDVELPGPGRLLLVTGSNMAGKTTLLRALGVNQVLALAGGPVAARELRTPPALPWTAMRIRDSLEEGVSYFLAELRRLQRVVAAARAHPVLYLLDEILQGTNTAERRTAARILLEHLLETRSLGAVTTHDLTLAGSDELQRRVVNVHFREEVREREGQRTLHFDYRLRPGPATSRNALLLLEMVGLGPSRGSSGPPPSGGPGNRPPSGPPGGGAAGEAPRGKG